MGRGRGRHLGCVPYKVFPRHACPAWGVEGETARTSEPFTQTKAQSHESFISETKGRERQTPPPAFSPTQPSAPLSQLGC